MSFLRLKNVEFGYSLPKTLLDKIRVTGIRVYLRGTNLLTFSSFKLWDPELKSTTGAANPAMKSVSFGLEFKL